MSKIVFGCSHDPDGCDKCMISALGNELTQLRAQLAEAERKYADECAGIMSKLNRIFELETLCQSQADSLATAVEDRDTLAGEVKAWRYEHMLDFSSGVIPSRLVTDASGALTRAGKDHP